MNLDELRKLAEAACEKHQDLLVEIQHMGDFNKVANPETVLKLITAIKKMREALEYYKEGDFGLKNEVTRFSKAAQCMAEVEALLK